MAKRPVFVPGRSLSQPVEEVEVEFKWFPGMARSQQQRSVQSLHQSAAAQGLEPLLEVSTRSEVELGRCLSAFNLKLDTRMMNPASVESAYQSSKVFEHGGPYLDLLDAGPGEAKGDRRLRESGDLKSFEFRGERWGLRPKTAFYDWLYLNALNELDRSTIQELASFRGFTDIAFNPKKSIACQARSVAMFVTLLREAVLDSVLESRSSFLSFLGEDGEDEPEQKLLF